MSDHRSDLQDLVATLQARLAKVEAEARFRNIYHDMDCESRRTNDDGDIRACTCGHDALRAVLEDSDEP